MTHTILRATLLAALLSAPAAAPVPSDGGTCVDLPILAHGTMLFLNVEGGCWQFLADDGTPYEPIGGPPEMYVHGVSGWMGGTIECDLASTCQVGTIVLVSSFGDFAGWTDLGNGLAGTFGVPTLSGTGTLIGGTSGSIKVSNADPGAAGALVAGFSNLSAPFMGGVMVPMPDLLIPANSGPGIFALLFVMPEGVPSGFTFYVQYWLPDDAGPHGFAASNAISGTTP